MAVQPKVQLTRVGQDTVELLVAQTTPSAVASIFSVKRKH